MYKNIVEIDKAIDALLYVKKKQLFLDSNKRTAVIFANHILIKGVGWLIVIPVELVNDYKKFWFIIMRPTREAESLDSWKKNAIAHYDRVAA